MSECPYKPLLDFDAFAHGVPHERIGEMRAEHRVLWEPDDHSAAGHWLVFRQADIDHVLHTPELFTSSRGPFLEDMPAALLDPKRLSINLMDPPAHRQYRSLVEYAFRPGLLKEREPIMRDMAREIIDRVIDRGSCEFVGEVAIHLPMRVMFYLLGVRPEERHPVRRRSGLRGRPRRRLRRQEGAGRLRRGSGGGPSRQPARHHDHGGAERRA
jgi:cholest-4-en-3-one 26-monooxygenase